MPAEQGMELGELLEDALFGMVRAWGAQVRFWAMFALWTGLVFGPVVLMRHAPAPSIALALVWVYTLPLLPSLLSGLMAPSVVRALGGAAPNVRAGSLLRASALGGLTLGLLRLFGLFACLLPALWITSAMGMLPAIMACEGLPLLRAADRASALSAGVRGQLAAALVVGLGGLCGLELIAVCLRWCVRYLLVRQGLTDVQEVALSLLFAAPLVLWCGFEASLQAVLYHRRRALVDRAALEDVFA